MQAATNAVAAYKQRRGARSPTTRTSSSSSPRRREQVGDAATAIAAYQRFLVLAPDDPNASIVKQQLKQLEQSSAAASG